MTEWRITFRCELLDDMHCGSGLGLLGFVDDRQARDAQGRPVVWGSTLAGLLRDQADALQALGHPAATPERIRRLFGAEGPRARGGLVTRSLHFHPRADDADRPVFLEVASTAREVHSRRPLDATLRTVEMAAAGLVAEGELRLTGEPADRSFVELCLRRLASLGGGKTRGAGQIQLSIQPSQEISPAAGAAGESPQAACRLRLLLRNLEPLCVPATGQPGNIIASETYIPGQTLRGAILTALGDRGATADDTDTLARPALVHFGNAYPVGKAAEDGDGQARRDLARCSAIPIPLTAVEAKATEREVDLAHEPWWLPRGPKSDSWRADPKVERDGLLDPTENRDAKFKRIKTEEYLVADASGGLRRLRPAMMTLMRNRTPVVRTERVFDSRRPLAAVEDLKKEKGDLFSAHVLVENQLFLADLRFESAASASLFWQRAVSLMGGKPDDRAWLRVGRGGCPVRVEAWQWVTDAAPQPLPPEADAFTLTLTSDLISRADDLTFHTVLDIETLARLAGIKVSTQEVSIDDKRSVSEPRPVFGFNTAAGARRSSAGAIKRGSAFVLGNSRTALAPLFAALAAREAVGLGLGERQEEGFGRFALNHPAHRPPFEQTKATAGAGEEGAGGVQDAESRARRVREEAIGEALDTVSREGLQNLCVQNDFPARGQWQQLRHKVEVVADVSDLNALFDTLRSRAGDFSGKMWACPTRGKPLWKMIDDRRRQEGELPWQRAFLIYLCRWVVAELDRLRREEKGD